MNSKELLDILIVLAGVVGVSLVFFFYFTNSKVRAVVNKVVGFLPFVLTFLKRFLRDKKGQFDTYDTLELTARVVERIKATIDDPTNKRFEDVEEEVFAIFRSEIARYKNLPGTPDLSDPAVRAQVRVVFEGIQRALANEDRTDNNS